MDDPNVLMGTDTSDDVGVYRLANGQALLMTVDFFTPIVDDPFTFGTIAAANSLSDIYAKGVNPLVALNLICFPQKLPVDMMVEILKGGAEKAMEASVPIIGGHTIDDPEPKYGLSVVAVAEPDKIITNAGAKPGDALVLTKALGTGVISTAIKRDKASEAIQTEAIATMSTLNKNASQAMVEVGVDACTDVTGFGLMGHLHEMISASGLGALVYTSKVPVINGTRELAVANIMPGGAYNNLNHMENSIAWSDSINHADKLILCDPQTSGGLLIALPMDKVDLLMSTMEKRGVRGSTLIGEITDDPSKTIQVLP
jgi:selenide,water dikinase